MAHDMHIQEPFLLPTPVTLSLSAESFLCSPCPASSIASTIRTQFMTAGMV